MKLMNHCFGTRYLTFIEVLQTRTNIVPKKLWQSSSNRLLQLALFPANDLQSLHLLRGRNDDDDKGSGYIAPKMEVL